MAQHVTYIAGVDYTPGDMVLREGDWISPGVLSLLDLLVTPGSGLAVNVSGGAEGSTGGNAWLPNGYRFYNDSSLAVALAVANAANPRIDLIVAGVDTTQNPYAQTIISITGTASVSPVAPTVPATFVGIGLAQVAVAANATTLTAGNITDTRTLAGIIPLTSHLAENATPTQIGHVEVSASPLVGSPVVLSRVANCSETKIATTSATNILTYTPTIPGNFEIKAYLRVITAPTVITVTATYTDVTGAQIVTILSKQSVGVGSGMLPTYFLNSVASAITLTITAGTANQVYVSSSIVGV